MKRMCLDPGLGRAHQDLKAYFLGNAPGWQCAALCSDQLQERSMGLTGRGRAKQVGGVHTAGQFDFL